MTKPVLYKANHVDFSNLGLGVLSDNIEALVTERINKEFYLEMKYPKDGKLFDQLKADRIIKADASPNLRNQRFKIVRVTKPTNGVVKVYANHVSYLADQLQLKPKVQFAGNAQVVLNTWKDNLVDENPFTVYSDIEHSQSGEWTIDKANTAKKALFGLSGSVLDKFGGEYRFDNYHIGLYQNRGDDKNALIAYGKNLTSLEQEEEISNTYTSIYPFSILRNEETEEETLITLPEYYIDSEHVNNFARRRIMVKDFSEEEIDNVDDLRSRTQTYIDSNYVGVPNVNMKVKFLDLAQTLDYKHLKAVEEINLADWVMVYFEDFNLREKAKVIKTVWNANLDRYEEIELGNEKLGLTESIQATVDESVQALTRRLNTVQLAADGKTRIFRGPDTPINANKDDVWFKPVGDGEIEMHVFDGSQWNLESISAGTLQGTINFANLNVINLIADNITGGKLNLANDLTISNGETDVLYIDPQTGSVVANFSELKINFKDVATKDEVNETINETINESVKDKVREESMIKDTLTSNFAPSHYSNNYDNVEVKERKTNTTIGVNGVNTHGILVSWTSNDKVQQTFISGEETFNRYGDATTDTWTEWTKQETDQGAKDKADHAFDGATSYALAKADEVEANAKKYTDALKDNLEGTINTQADDIVQLQSDVTANNSHWLQTFSASGGVNELRNSVGYADLEFWEGSGNITSTQNAELETYGSGSAFILGASSHIQQQVIGESGPRMFSVIVEKDSASSGYIEITHDDGTELISLNAGEELKFVRYELPFELTGTQYTVKLATDASSEILLTNIMVNYGTERQRWGFANDEIYGSTFRMNRNGFRVYHLDGQQYTAMTPDEFAGYAVVGGVWKRTFALNGDTTEMNKAQVESEIGLGMGKFIYVNSSTSHGIAVVRGG